MTSKPSAWSKRRALARKPSWSSTIRTLITGVILAARTGPVHTVSHTIATSAAVRSGTEVREHGQHAAVIVGRRGQVELSEDARDVLFDRPLAHHQLGGDRVV